MSVEKRLTVEWLLGDRWETVGRPLSDGLETVGQVGVVAEEAVKEMLEKCELQVT